MNYRKKFRVLPGSKVDLKAVDAGFADKHETHQDALAEIEAHDQKLHDLHTSGFGISPSRALCRRPWSL